MAWIDGEERRVFVVNAPVEQVADFFCDPARFKDARRDLDSAVEVEPGTWHWTLKEKAEKGIRFQGSYKVKYTRTGHTLTWDTLPGGNMKSTGSTICRDLNGKTEVTYHESLATDLPIPGLMAKVFKPIVAREIANGIGAFLESGKALVEGK
jgi:uncharacterized membrane protein